MGEQADIRADSGNEAGRQHVVEVLRRERRRRWAASAAVALVAAALVTPYVLGQIDLRRWKPTQLSSVTRTTADDVIRVEAGNCEAGLRVERLIESPDRVVLFLEAQPGEGNDCGPPRIDVVLSEPLADREVVDGYGLDGVETVVLPAPADHES